MLKGRRIIIVLEYLALGGSERQALLLARYLSSEKRAGVQVWGFKAPGRVIELCEEHAIPWRIVRFRWHRNRLKRLMALNSFAWKLRRSRPDVVLSYNMLPNIACALTRRLSEAKVCIWNQRDEGRNRQGRKVEEKAVRKTSHFVSNSKHGADFLVRKLGVKPELCSVIPNGIELGPPLKSGLEWRRDLGASTKTFVACMIANLTMWKDHSSLLKAWRLFISRFGNNHVPPVLWLAGRLDSAYQGLKLLASELKLGQTVKFLGPVYDLAGLLDAVDLGVFSSKLEGCPNGVLECMAAGLPVVGTDIPGIREAVGPEGSPYLAVPGDPESLSNKLQVLADNPHLREELGFLGRRRVQTNFSAKKMCEKTARLIAKGLCAVDSNYESLDNTVILKALFPRDWWS